MPDQLVCSQEVTGAFSKFKGLEFKLYNFTIKKIISSVCVCAQAGTAGQGSSSPLSAFCSSEKKSLQTGKPACCQRKLMVNI